MNSHNIFLLWVLGITCLLLLNGCVEPPSSKDEVLDYSIDITAIPKDTIKYSQPNLVYVNGEYLLDNEPYSGIIYKVLKGYNVSTYSSVLNGKLHGTYKSFYASGKPYEIRKYRNGLSVGKHIGYWESTRKLKFEYNDYEQKKEGVQKSWYADGRLAYAYHYKDDSLDGLQQAWRENGSLYRNFVVKNGVSYGLQKSKTCYEVSDENIILQASKIKGE
jgi:antitoxin component YwqK of YwqJK toxin-antitoxin module